jgi:hypothetical protein
MSLISSNNIIIKDNVINVLNKDIEYDNEIINKIKSKSNYTNNMNVLIDKTGDDYLIIYLGYIDNNNLYII